MNSDWSDRVFDSLLEEAVSGRRPPNLLARITTAWQLENVSQVPLPTAANANQELIAPPIAQPLSQDSLPHVRSIPLLGANQPKRISHAWPILLVVAASGILVVSAIRFRALLTPKDVPLAQAKTQNTNADSQQRLPQVAIPKVEREPLSLENVPFTKPNVDQTAENIQSLVAKAEQQKLDRQQIVELIDTQLAVLWKRMDVTPTSRLGDLQLSQAISRVLTGQDFVSSPDNQPKLDAVISKAMDSQSFARRWAEQIVAQWLPENAATKPNVRRLEQFVANGIANRRPWNEVVTPVIAGDSTDDAFAATLAGGGNHRIVSRLSGVFLASSLACVRCHEAKGTPDDVAQEQYWSVLALLMGLDTIANEPSGERKAIDKQVEIFAENKQPSLFFDRPDGTLQAAKFMLPDGKPWQSIVGAKTPRAALADWIGNSSQSDQAVVNQVWRIVFGRPIVATNSLVDDVGLAERTELQRLLAQQFRAHGRNLSELVGWLIRSDAFAREAILIDKNRWLQASENEIADWHLAEMTFAAKTSFGERSPSASSDLENSLAAVLKWNPPNEPGTTLGQPQTSLDPKLKVKSSMKSGVVMPSASYAIHHGRLSKAQNAYLDRLVASEKLSWEQKVEHVVSLAPNLAMTGGVKRRTEDLLKSLDGQRAVLIELLWAVQNAEPL